MIAKIIILDFEKKNIEKNKEQQFLNTEKSKTRKRLEKVIKKIKLETFNESEL